MLSHFCFSLSPFPRHLHQLPHYHSRGSTTRPNICMKNGSNQHKVNPPPSILSSSSSSSTYSLSSCNGDKCSSSNCLTIYDTLLPGTHDSAAYISVPNIPSRLTERTLLVWSPLRSLTSTLASEFALTQTQTIYEQLKNGCRFLDLRITKPASTTSKKDQFWTHHGIVLCAPLRNIIKQINQFHDDVEKNNINNTNKISIVLVFRFSLLSIHEQIDMSNFIYCNLKHSCYYGNAHDLKYTCLNNLPHNILVGLYHSKIPLSWGKDIWIDTYNPSSKINFLKEYLLSLTESGPPKNDDLLVIGWTITPSIYDIILRVCSFGFIATPLLPKAIYFNSLFQQFASESSPQLQSKANVVFFDAFSKDLAQQVEKLNKSKVEERVQQQMSSKAIDERKQDSKASSS